MVLIRRFEESCVELYSAGEIHGFVHLYIGEEAVAVGVNQALTAEDSIVSTYREHGHSLVRGIPIDALMAEMDGKTTGCSGGRGGCMHPFDAKTRFYAGNAIVGGGLPLAVGLALADRMRGDARVTACFFGDGAVAEGAAGPARSRRTRSQPGHSARQRPRRGDHPARCGTGSRQHAPGSGDAAGPASRRGAGC